uniref:Uncharacterized protein n=1 Tax=Tanacetum cinerariifolium TaxID=118510 RepID=A0A6L2JK79_TANCI|nr:hypothetical protein [Tanacetum cinerariifolium]
MPIPIVMLSEEIKASKDYLNYLAKSMGTQPIKVKGKWLLTKKGVEVVNETVRIPNKRCSETVIEETVQTKSDEGTLDHSRKLKGVERMFETIVFLLEMKQARKVSKQDFILKQRSKGPGEGSGAATKVPKGLSGSSSSSISESDVEIEDKSSDEERSKAYDSKKAEADKAKKEKVGEEQHVDDQGGNKQARDVQAKVHVSEPQTEKPATTRLTRLKKKVDTMSKIDHTEVIDKSVQAHLKNVLPKDVTNFGKIKQEKAAKQSMPKYSTKPFDEASLKEYDLKDKLIKLMMKSKSYNTHPAHMKLYDAMMDSLLIDENDMDKQLDD